MFFTQLLWTQVVPSLSIIDNNFSSGDFLTQTYLSGPWCFATLVRSESFVFLSSNQCCALLSPPVSLQMIRSVPKIFFLFVCFSYSFSPEDDTYKLWWKGGRRAKSQTFWYWFLHSWQGRRVLKFILNIEMWWGMSFKKYGTWTNAKYLILQFINALHIEEYEKLNEDCNL